MTNAANKWHFIVIIFMCWVVSGCGTIKVPGEPSRRGRFIRSYEEVQPEKSILNERVSLSIEGKSLLALVTLVGNEGVKKTTEYESIDTVEVEKFEGIGKVFNVLLGNAILVGLPTLFGGPEESMLSYRAYTKPQKEQAVNSSERIREYEYFGRFKNVPVKQRKIRIDFGPVGTKELITNQEGKTVVELEPLLRRLVRDYPWTISATILEGSGYGQPPATLTVNTSSLGVTWDEPRE